MHIQLEFHQLNLYFGRLLDNTVTVLLDDIIHNEQADNMDSKAFSAFSSKSKNAVDYVQTNHKNLQLSPAEINKYASFYFDTKFPEVLLKQIKQKGDWYHSPGGSLVYLPDITITHLNSDNAVYSFNDYNGTPFSWDYREDLYYDLYGNVYSPRGETIIGDRTPRYIKMAYKKLLQIRIKNPHASISSYTKEDGVKQAVISDDTYPGGVQIWGGDNVNFNDEKYPDVGTGESFIPIWGSGRSMMYNLEAGDNWGAAFDAGMAISDVFLVKSLIQGVAKGGLKVMTKNYGSWSSYRRFYGKEGFAQAEQPLHHWAWQKGATKGSGLSWKLKNQMWNLKQFPNQASHMRWGHGKNYLDLERIPYWKQAYFFKSTPTWFKASLYSGGRRTYNLFGGDE